MATCRLPSLVTHPRARTLTNQDSIEASPEVAPGQRFSSNLHRIETDGDDAAHAAVPSADHAMLESTSNRVCGRGGGMELYIMRHAIAALRETWEGADAD